MSILTAPIRFIESTGQFALFVGAFFSAIRRHGIPWRMVLKQAYDIGIKSMPILLIIAGFVGTNLALQGFNAFQPLGGERLVGLFVALAGLRELAPIIAAAMVAAKAGTEMASQIGVMRIREQIDALEVMGVNPMSYLIAPRLIGILIVLPALTTMAIFIMIASGYCVSVFQLGLNGHVFLEFASQGVEPIDLLYGQIKGFIFGLLICLLSCWYGFFCDGGPEGVGQATNRAVVSAAVACVTVNYFLSELMYGGST